MLMVCGSMEIQFWEWETYLDDSYDLMINVMWINIEGALIVRMAVVLDLLLSPVDVIFCL